VTRYRETLWGTLDTTFHNVGLLLLLNLATTLLLFPVLVLITLGLSATGLLSAFPLTAALAAAVLSCPLVAPLQIASNRLARGYAVWILRDSREFMGKHGFLVLRLWLLDLLITAGLIANIGFYTTHTAPIAIGLRVLFVYLLFGWLAMHIYVYPLIVEDRTSGLLDTYRKTFQLSLLFPVYTMVIGAIWLALVAVLSLFGILAVLGLALTVSLQHHALAALLERSPLES
jgi:hypothetical protein